MCGSTATVDCTAGYTLMGGGASMVDGGCGGGTMDWFYSMPEGNGWKCGWDEGTAICYAICVKIQ